MNDRRFIRRGEVKPITEDVFREAFNRTKEVLESRLVLEKYSEKKRAKKLKRAHLAAAKRRLKERKDYLAKHFLTSDSWQELRFRFLKVTPQVCVLCGAKGPLMGGNAELHVDHIKPRSIYPELSLEFSNLQMLCKPCNFGKGNLDDTDFVKKKAVALLKT